MPVPLIAMAAGAAIGIGVGYVEDHYFGDSNYTAKEAAIDGLFGGVGAGGIYKTGKYGYKAVRWQRRGQRAKAAGPGAVMDYTVLGIRTGSTYTAMDAREMALYYGTAATIHAGATLTSSAIDGYTNRTNMDNVVSVRTPYGSDYVETRNPITVALLNLAEEVSPKSSKVKGRPKKRCRCPDGSYSTKCCK